MDGDMQEIFDIKPNSWSDTGYSLLMIIYFLDGYNFWARGCDYYGGENPQGR